MDELDSKILDILESKARISMRELGKSISLSNSATADRVRRLEEAGVIRGYRTDINRALLGDAVHAFVIISFKHELRLKEQPFWDYVRATEQIRSTFHILTGGADYMLEIFCTDMEALVAIQQQLFNFGATVTYMAGL